MNRPAAPSSVGRDRRARAGERAFALPLVVMLTLVVVVIVAAMLGRQGTQGTTVARQAEEVRDWHFSRGVREIVDQWLKNKALNSVRDNLAVDGRAFDLVLDDETRMSFYLLDAQGTLLTTVVGLGAEETLDAVGALDSLRQSVGASEFERMTRQVGPPEVSLWTAPPEVLNAVCRQTVGPEGADELTRTLIELRQTKDKITPADLNEAATKVSVSEARRRSFLRMIAAEPSFYRFILDVRPPQSSTPVARYTGYLVARSPLQRTGGVGRTATPPPRSAFLSWEKVPPR